jgi:hypothetical protein
LYTKQSIGATVVVVVVVGVPVVVVVVDTPAIGISTEF